MRGVIFGGGVVAVIAKKLLPGWDIVPFGRSRYYSFNPPLADNCISCDDELADAVATLGISRDEHIYRRGYSVGGELVCRPDRGLCAAWLTKVFGGGVPAHAQLYMDRRMSFLIYGTRVNSLYASLQSEFADVLKSEAAKGPVTEVGDHYFVRGGVRTDFDMAISTIPLSVLAQLSGRDLNLKCLNEHFVLVRSTKIDLESMNQALVTDAALDFYRVSNISKHTYMFYFLNEAIIAGAYLLPIIGSCDVVDGTMVRDSIPAGDIPDVAWLKDMGIVCVGSQAQHDWCADVGSNILRLTRLIGSDFK